MEPVKNLYSFKCSGNARGRTFYVMAENFADAADKAQLWIRKHLDESCDLKTVTFVAEDVNVVSADEVARLQQARDAHMKVVETVINMRHPPIPQSPTQDKGF